MYFYVECNATYYAPQFQPRKISQWGPLWQKKFPDGLRLKLASILLLLDLKRQLYSRGICRLLHFPSLKISKSHTKYITTTSSPRQPRHVVQVAIDL